MDKKYEPELNSVTEFKLKRAGMIEEIKTEFDIIKLGLLNKDNNSLSSDVPERIIVMPLRKLLCERSSVLLNVEPNFKMPKLEGNKADLSDKLVAILPPYSMTESSSWIPVEDWLEQSIAYYDKTVDDLSYAVSAETYIAIKNKLKNGDKALLDSMMEQKNMPFQGETENCYVVKNPGSEDEKTKIFSLFKKAGYYDLSIYVFLKHLSDKRGAHIDAEIEPLIKIMNDATKDNWTAVKCLALQMIYAATHQITELKDYWPDLKM